MPPLNLIFTCCPWLLGDMSNSFGYQIFFGVIIIKNNSHGVLDLPPNYIPTTKLWGHLAFHAIVG